jgi:hypothetical protein
MDIFNSIIIIISLMLTSLMYFIRNTTTKDTTTENKNNNVKSIMETAKPSIGVCNSTDRRITTCDSGNILIDNVEYKGYLEGGTLEYDNSGLFDVYNTNCTNREDCFIPFPEGIIDSLKPTVCYSGKDYEQMSKDINCQKLPLPKII